MNILNGRSGRLIIILVYNGIVSIYLLKSYFYIQTQIKSLRLVDLILIQLGANLRAS